MNRLLYFDEVLDNWVEFTPTEEELETLQSYDWNRVGDYEHWQGTILINGQVFTVGWLT